MRNVLAYHPDYRWGWRNLADWLCVAGPATEYLEAAEALLRLTPSDPVALAIRGEARFKTDDRAGARNDFRRALELADHYAFAAFYLFDIELADEDYEAAARTLETLKLITGGQYVVAREVQLAVGRDDPTAAREALRRLCTGTEGTADWPIRAANNVFVQAGWGRQAEETYHEFLDRAEAHPLVGALWIERRAAVKDWTCGRRLDPLLSRGEIGRRAMVAYLTALGGAGALAPIRACIRRHRARLRQDTGCWGSAGYALMAARRPRAAAVWLSDWADRGDAQPWMLINLVLALRALCRVSDANRVSRRALELAADSTTPYHRLWLAVDEALDGDSHAAAEQVRQIDASSLKTTNLYLYRLAALLIQSRQALPGQRRGTLKETGKALDYLGLHIAIPADDLGAVVKTYRRAVLRMARERGGVRGMLWLLCHWLTPPRTAV
jgi:hypothetical protein